MSLAKQFEALADLDDLPITRAMAQWDGKYTKDALDRLHEVMTSDLLYPDAREDGIDRIRPSTIGEPCPRPALLSFLGDAGDPWPQAARAIADAGTWRHYSWQVAGLSAGFLDDIEVPLSHEPWRMRGSADGIGRIGVFEFKSTSGNIFKTVSGAGPGQRSPKRAHFDQINAYMVATGLDVGSIVYEDRTYMKWFEVRVHRDLQVVDALNRRFQLWNHHIDAGTLPPILPDCWQQSGATFRSCDWKDACFARG